jgi:hypothetical protein
LIWGSLNSLEVGFIALICSRVGVPNTYNEKKNKRRCDWMIWKAQLSLSKIRGSLLKWWKGPDQVS